MAAAAYQQQIENIYLAYYGRPADPTGLTYWEYQLVNANGNLSTIINAFATSAESTALYGGLPVTQQINAIYESLFGHAADLAGLNYYVQAINSGTFTLASVALNIFNGATSGDATILAQKIAYSAAFTTAVAGSAEAQNAYIGTTSSTNTRTVIDNITTAASEQTAITNLTTTLANIDVTTPLANTGGTTAITNTGGSTTIANTGGNTGPQTLTFVAGTIATFTPTGNTAIYGIINTSATFAAPDTITATGTGNVFNILDAGGGTALPTGAPVSGVQTVNLTSTAASGLSNFTGYTGLIALNVMEVGGTTALGVTAAATTNITLTDSATVIAAVTVQGGLNDSVTVSGATAVGATVTVGTTAAVAGTLAVVETNGAITANTTFGATTTHGGTVVTITDNEVGTLLVTATGGAITETGAAGTTSVTVHQSAAVAPTVVIAAAAGAATAAPVSAAPGINGVTAATIVNSVVAQPAALGVVDGAVSITDASYGTTTANTMTTVALSNYAANTVNTINDNALTNLSMSGTATALVINNSTTGTASPAANSTLSLMLTSLSAPAIAAGVVTSAKGGNNTLTDTNNEITTLNVTTATGNSVLTAFVDSNLTTVNIAGTNALALTSLNTTNDAALTTVAVSGAAGFNDGNSSALTGLGSYARAIALTTTSSGVITAALNSTLDTFTGSTGQDIITISDLTDAGKAITAGSASNNELILDGIGGPYALTAATANLVTGFQTLGVTSHVTGTINLAVLDANASLIDVIGSASGITFSGAATGAAISLDSSIAGAVAVGYADSNGTADSSTVTFGAVTNATALSALSLSLADNAGVGIGTVNIVSNDMAYTAGNTGNLMTTLVDNNLSTLKVSGTGALTIGTLNETHGAATFTLTNTDTGAGTAAAGNASITSFTDPTLATLTFAGPGNSSIGTLTDGAIANVTIANTGAGTTSLTSIADTALLHLTLTGNVAYGTNTSTAPTAVGVTTGFTLSGATDNAHVNVNLTGVAAGLNADTITLGNGNNFITDGSVSGTVNITVGTGSNLINVSANTGTLGGGGNHGLDTIILGTHSLATGVDSISVGYVGIASNDPLNAIITGTSAGDIITVTDSGIGVGGAISLTPLQQSTVNSEVNFAAAASFAAGLVSRHEATSFQYGGNTYMLEKSATASDALIELTGLHTITAGNVTGSHLVLAS